MKKWIQIALLSIFYVGFISAQESNSNNIDQNDSIPYELFKDKIVLYSDLGFNSAPFSLKDEYNFGVKKLKYKNNIRPALGFGVAYKWFGIRIGFTLPINLLSKSRYGISNYFDAGIKFNIKKTFCNIDLRSYVGYAIKDEYKWNDSLTSLQPNGIYSKTKSSSLSANVWYFKDSKFKMQAVLGKVGHYESAAKTWYFKSTLNFFGLSTDGTLPIVPAALNDSSERIGANTIGAIDLGFIPGYAYVNRVNNWQFAVFGGLGGVIQSKFYSRAGLSRAFLGIAPRVDLRIIGGYSKPNYFVLLTTDFDIKSVNIQTLKFNQTFYHIKIIGGIRLTKKDKAKRKD